MKRLRSDGLYIDYDNTINDEYPNLKTVLENHKHTKCHTLVLKQENIIYNHMHEGCLTDAYIKSNGGPCLQKAGTYHYYCFECQENLFVEEIYIDNSNGE
tara:strand:+ start:61 stop:360 length:300 start_codon:yes stop_codon:yes gene_type:complete